MREILFRGKSKNNNEWVFGDLIQGENTYISAKEDFYSAVVNLEGHLSTFVKIVNKDTLGQYTGLKDKNGNEIFEGDIVKLKELNYNYEWTAIIEFGNPNGEYLWGWNLKPITKNIGYNTDILCWVEMPIGATCEVIGNIYDNPEMLKGENNGKS